MPYTLSPQTSETELSGIEGVLDAIQRREDAKWRGHVVHEAQTTVDFALRVLLQGFVVGFGGLMLSRGRIWTGSSMAGLGAYMTYEELRQFCGENKLATAATYLAGEDVSLLKNYVVLEGEQLQVNPSEMTQAVMRLVDGKNKVIGLAFKYFDTAFCIDEKKEKVGLSVIRVFDFEKRFKCESKVDLTQRIAIIVSNQLWAQDGREMEELFIHKRQNKLRFTE